MLQKITELWRSFFYSFPIRLLLNHLKRNHILLLCWVVLFAIISGNFGNYLGIPYLFLDPVYLNKVNFTSFFIIGVVIAGFSIAFHIATYIDDGHRFSFIGTISKPFTVFSLNNSIIPFFFLFLYVIFIIRYQFSNEYITEGTLLSNIAGLLIGYLAMTSILLLYFWFTNNDIFKYAACKVDEKLKQNIKATRASAMKKLDIARKKQIRVDGYVNLRFDYKKVEDHTGFYDRSTILQVFDQNHFNLVIIQLFIFALLLIMGVFKDYELFQLPAAASVILFLTIFVMLAGAFSYWFGSWAATSGVIMLIVLNLLMKGDFVHKSYEAFGLDYHGQTAPYDLPTIQALNSRKNLQHDQSQTLEILNRWRKKFGNKKPKLIFLCVSGGGQRAALWTLNALQTADSMSSGKLMDHTMLITGASGGLIGASYFRELVLMKKRGLDINPYNKEYQNKIASDNLNAIIFSLLMNDLFVGFTKFEYNGLQYDKDRGYAFEHQLNANTEGILDKPLSYYKQPEKEGIVPMLIMAPTVINDGRKLYISPQNVSYMMELRDSTHHDAKISGIEFMRFYKNQGSEHLRFLSGLRMSATFPYITPNITLPSSPPMEIMDAGITDNFGISDAVKFMFVFRKWIEKNTSGVIFLAIRDSEKDPEVKKETALSLFDQLTLPISSIYQNFQSLQDITNDNKIEYAKAWFKGRIDRIDIEYIPKDFNKQNLSVADSLRMENIQRVSLSWRLTGREKRSLVNNIKTKKNMESINELIRLMED